MRNEEVNKKNRVLGRVVARELRTDEVKRISGAHSDITCNDPYISSHIDCGGVSLDV